MSHSHLNPAQKKAVETLQGRVLILAGAGSGKTSVLTYRIKHLITEHQVPPSSILGLTFTNKAASEMRERIAKMLGDEHVKKITLCTFHSFCMAILRREIVHLGYTKEFSLYGEKEIKRLITQMARLSLNHEGELPSLEPTFAKIAESRSLGKPIVVTKNSPWHESFAKELHERLGHCLRAYNAVDFDGLLSLTAKLFDEFPDVLTTYQDHFRYIMIDEYQDTNPVQYQIADLLSKKHGNLCVVGDDDQSIYGWRGAKIEHILHFEAKTTIKLEQNYRSTGSILQGANAVIRNNQGRHPKELWSSLEKGAPIELFHAPTESDEASAITQRILRLKQEFGIPWKEIAVLYRANNLAREMELSLLQATWQKADRSLARGIPYTVFGGLEFTERSEIKDLFAYLRMIANPLDEEAILRIINVPRRGISDQTLEKVTAYNRSQKRALWDVLLQISLEGIPSLELSDKAQQSIASFTQLMIKYQNAFKTDSLYATLAKFIEEINYRKAIEEEVKSDKMRAFKWDNLEEYIESLKTLETESQGTLSDFISAHLLDERHVREGIHAEKEDKVHLMTFHSAKGLEFTACFLIGLEEGIIPHEKSLTEGSIEEERRLMYVAMTRAKRRLYLSMAKKRKHMGKEKERTPSRFLFEIPKEALHLTFWKTAY